MYILSILSVCFLLPLVKGDVTPSEDFPNQVELVAEDEYWLFWKIDGSNVTFEIHVMTLGWVAFGLSPDGGMAGSDVIMGYVKDGDVTFSDRFASGNSLPTKDVLQNWELLSGSESGNYTILKFMRPLYTCDFEYDRNITENTVRVIWAYHAEDPDDLDLAAKHEARGSRSLLLLNHRDVEPTLPENTISMDVVMEQYTIPVNQTNYYCKMFQVPDPDVKKHIMKFEPVIEEGHELLVHHMVLYMCDDDTLDDDDIGAEGECLISDSMSKYAGCISPLFAWAIGGTTYSYPANVGFPVGGAGKIRFIQLEIHYDNAENAAGLNDSSGMRLYMSESLREYDAATTIAGVTVTPYHIIPPRLKHFRSDGYCSEACLRTVLGEDDMHIFSVLLHTNLAGTSVKLRHFREGIELPVIAQDDDYDFNYQETRSLASEVTVKVGDTLKVECIYNTEDRETLTLGGVGTKEEMCLAFINFYPFKQLYSCTSVIEAHAMAAYYDLQIVYDNEFNPIISEGEYVGWNLVTLLYFSPWEEDHMPALTKLMATQGPFVTECKKTAVDILPSMWTVMEPPLVKELTDPHGVCVGGQFTWISQAASPSYHTAHIISLISSIFTLISSLHLM